MREIQADLWDDYGKPGHRIAISTNGYLKRNGEGVMGRGCARQAAILHPEFPSLLGVHLKERGNVPGYLIPNTGHELLQRVMVLPVKDVWYHAADLGLVQASIDWLKQEALRYPDWEFHVPRLGCGNGKLDWRTQVRQLMLGLPDNVVVHS